MTAKKLTFIEILIGGFFIFLPFERLLTAEFFGLTLKISFVILLLIILAYFCLSPGPKLALEDKIILAFIALSYFSAFWSIDQLRSLIISTIFAATFVGYITLRRFLTAKNVEVVKTIIIYSGFILSFFALWQYFGNLFDLPLTFLRPQYTKAVFGFPRPQATFLEPLYFANFLFLPLFFTFERFVKSQKLPRFLTVNLFLLSAILLLCLSRGAYLGFLAALIASAIIISIKFKILAKKFWLGFLIIFLGIATGVLTIYFSSDQAQFNLFVRHAGIADAGSGESTLARFNYSSIAWHNFLHRPWGIGAGAFGALPEFSDKLLVGNYQTVGNLYLEILVEEGAIGLLLFIIFLFLNIKHLWKNIRQGKFESLVSLAIFVAIFVQAVAFSALYILPIWAFLALAWSKSKQ